MNPLLRAKHLQRRRLILKIYWQAIDHVVNADVITRTVSAVGGDPRRRRQSVAWELSRGIYTGFGFWVCGLAAGDASSLHLPCPNNC